MKTGIIGATILISATTIDDAVWLVPYTTSSHLPLHTKVLHGLSFILTLECLSLLCVGINTVLERGLLVYFNGSNDANDAGGGGDTFHNDTDTDNGDGDGDAYMRAMQEKIGFIMQCVGVVLCWSIAIGLLVKKMLKRRRRQKRNNDENNNHHHPKTNYGQTQEEQGLEQGQGCKPKRDGATVGGEEEEHLLSSQHQHQHLQVAPSTTSSLGQNAIHSIGVSMDTTMSSFQSDTIATTATPSTQIQQQSSSFGSIDHGGEIINLDNNDNGDNENDDPEQNNSNENVQVQNNDEEINAIPTTPSIGMVISLTTLGALDEISYFPALIMGKIFTPMELCVGAFFASILILGVIVFFLGRCKPLVDCLDRIPLYGIVGMFAVVLTIGLFF